MKKRYSILLTALTGILLLTANLQCQKFEDDTELIHFRTKKKRIEGLKELTMHQLGPTDLMPYWHSRFGDFYLNLTLISYNPYKKGYGYQVRVYDKATNNLICDGQWGFMGSERIFIHFDCLDADTTTSFPDGWYHELYGTIVRLSNKEMWFRNHTGLIDSPEVIVIEEIRFREYKKN